MICSCGHELQVGDWPFCESGHSRAPRHDAEWDDHTAVTVFRKPDGSYSYPMRADAPTPSGYERVTLRSMQALQRFEKQAGVRSHMAWFDEGSGRGHDDHYRGQRYD